MPYQLLVDQEPVSAEEIDDTRTRIAVWTDDQANRDFLMLMTELGVTVTHAVPDNSVSDAKL